MTKSNKRDAILVLCGLFIGLACYSPVFVSSLIQIGLGVMAVIMIHFIVTAVPMYWRYQRLGLLKQNDINRILKNEEPWR